MEEQANGKGKQPAYTTYHTIQGTLYIVEHEAGPNATETVSEKIKRMILRDVEQSFRRKLWGFIVPIDILIDFLSAICNYIRAWRLSKGGKDEKTISLKHK